MLPGKVLTRRPVGASSKLISAGAETQNAPATDYDRACDIDDYLGLIVVGEGQGLVLGEGRMDTAWWPGDKGDGGILIRWEYGEPGTDVLQALSHIPEDIWQPEPLVFTVGEGPLFLFDSAFRGSDVDDGLTNDHATVLLPAGEYALATAHYRPDDQTSFVLHRLSWKK